MLQIAIPAAERAIGTRQVALLSVAGVLLRSKKVDLEASSLHWSLEGLTAGTYFVRVEQGGRVTHLETLVKQ